MTNSFILLMAGSGTRSGLSLNKVLVEIDNQPVFIYSLKKAFEASFDEYILVISKKDEDLVKSYLQNYHLLKKVKITYGGQTRAISVKNALKEVTTDVAFFHDAARCLVNVNDIISLKKEATTSLSGTLYHESMDTLKDVSNGIKTIDRKNIYQVTTPQFFNKVLFEKIINNKLDVTDEIAIIEKECEVSFVKETSLNLKLTTKEDFYLIEKIIKSSYEQFIGHSLDYHPYSDSGKLILGGVAFEDYPILQGHSDADVLYHVVTEAIMGASKLGDLGTLFPDTDPSYKGISSSILLEEVIRRITALGYIVNNIDVTVYLLKPNLKNYKKQMEQNIIALTNCNHVNVKAATLNKRGLISLEEGIGAEAIVSLNKYI